MAQRGVTVLGYPVLREEALGGLAPGLERAVAECSLVAFTSRRAPAALRQVAGELWPALQRLPAAAVGAATAEAARREGFRVEIVGDSGGAALATLLAGVVRPGEVVLHPCGREHREEFGRALAGTGVRVLPVVVYCLAETAVADLPSLPPDLPRAVLLTSPRAARAYLNASGGRYVRVPHLAFGPTTAAAAAEAGLQVRPLSRHTPEAVVEELCRTCS
jgi:uroporphyrinogen-III synthase